MTSPQLQIYKIDSVFQEWLEQATDTAILLPQYEKNQKELIAISADGNRFAVSSFIYNVADTTQGRIAVYDWTTATNGGNWIRLEPPISSPSNDNGFGRSISMDDGGTLLVDSAVDPNCDGLSPFEEYYDGELLWGINSSLCHRIHPTLPAQAHESNTIENTIDSAIAIDIIKATQHSKLPTNTPTSAPHRR